MSKWHFSNWPASGRQPPLNYNALASFSPMFLHAMLHLLVVVEKKVTGNCSQFISDPLNAKGERNCTCEDEAKTHVLL